MYKVEPLPLLFKDKDHENDFFYLMIETFKRPFDDREYGSLSYLVAATGKTGDVINIYDHEGLDIDILRDRMGVYSSSEIAMIRFGLQLFNSNIDDIKLNDVFWSLDDENTAVVKAAIDYRFR